MRKEIEAALQEAKQIEQVDQGTDSAHPKGRRKRKKISATEVLLECAAEAELFQDECRFCYARVHVDGHTEVMPVQSAMFERWLIGRYYRKTGLGPSKEAKSVAISTVEAKAHSEGRYEAVSVRVGFASGVVYVDLGGPEWQVVEIDAEGWRLRNDAPVALIRPPGLAQLPVPTGPGDIELLRKFLNVDDASWTLAASWLVGAFLPRGTFPVLTFTGEQGTGKSTASDILRSLIDPSVASLQTIPKSEEHLFIAASNSWTLCFDNISFSPPWLSDALCRIAKGGALRVRQLHTNAAEVIFTVRRPIILNGIDSVITRHDLADRALFCTLQPIPDDRRIPESELYQELKTDAPFILAGIFDAVSRAIRDIDTLVEDDLPRLADFSRWVCAAETALPWVKGRFRLVYSENRSGTVATALSNSALGSAVLQLTEQNPAWKGTPTELLRKLEEIAGEKAVKQKGWPGSAGACTKKLRELSSFLRRMDVEIGFADQMRIGESRFMSVTRIEKAN